MFQHDYDPGFWHKLAERLPFVILVALLGGAFFAGFSRSFWGTVICVIDVIVIAAIAALYWRYRSEESELDAGKKGRF
jgi:hypothetical protein